MHTPDQPPVRLQSGEKLRASDDIPKRWMIRSPWRIVLALLVAPFCGAIAWAILHHENFSQWPLGVVTFIAAGCCVLPFSLALEGGVTVDRRGKLIVRWWGPGIPLRWVTIPYGEVRQLVAEMNAKPAHDAERRYGISLVTDVVAYNLKLDLRDAASARDFAEALSRELNCPWQDLLHDELKLQHAHPAAEPPASRRVRMLVAAAVCLSWIPLVGLVLTACACYAVRRVAIPTWANAMLLLGFFLSVAMSIVGVLILLGELAGRR